MKVEKKGFNKGIEEKEKDGLGVKWKTRAFENSGSKEDDNSQMGEDKGKCRESNGENSFDTEKVEITDMEGLEDPDNINSNRHSIHLRCMNGSPSPKNTQSSQNYYLTNYTPNKTSKPQFPFQRHLTTFRYYNQSI